MKLKIIQEQEVQLCVQLENKFMKISVISTYF